MDAAEPTTDATTASTEAVSGAAGATTTDILGAGPQRYIFSQPTLFADAELRKLRSDFEEVRAACNMRLAVLFRTECELNLTALETPTFRQFTAGCDASTHLTLFKIESLRGIGVFEITSGLALALTDRLMGGPGAAGGVSRELSEIEVALLDQIVHLFTEAWCSHWAGWREFKSTLLGHESDPRYLQTAPADSSMLVAKFEVKIAEASGHVAFAFPFATIEPLIQKLRAEAKPPTDPAPAKPAGPAPATWNHAFDEVRIAVQAALSGPQVTARALPQLKVGDVLPLAPESANLIRLSVGGTTRFTGRLGTRDDHWAIEVLKVLKV